MRFPRFIIGAWLLWVSAVTSPAWAETLIGDEQSLGEIPVVRALVKPRLNTTLASRLSARIARTSTHEGGHFDTGDPLIEFDCVVQKAHLKKAEATLLQAEKTLASRLELKRLNAVSDIDLAIARADAHKAKADIALTRADVGGCVVSAPFKGRVVELLAKTHEHVTPGQPLIEILDDTAMRLEILTPAELAVGLGVGKTLSVTIDETGRSYRARIRAMGAKVDPASQTLQVYADVENHDAALLAGMSGTVRFDTHD